jgi:cysteine-rich repeat protein
VRRQRHHVAGDVCDDGNSKPGDGCSGVCEVEPGYGCPTPGQPCVLKEAICGDAQISGGEACDDGNKAANDGCSATCQVEPGWACATPGQPCTPVTTSVCGDGAVNSGEQCDDGGTTPTDGCSATCTLETGWVCPNPGQPCVKNEYCLGTAARACALARAGLHLPDAGQAVHLDLGAATARSIRRELRRQQHAAR